MLIIKICYVTLRPPGRWERWGSHREAMGRKHMPGEARKAMGAYGKETYAYGDAIRRPWGDYGEAMGRLWGRNICLHK